MDLPEFRNEPLCDFNGNPEQFRRMKQALDGVGEKLGHRYPLVIGSERIETNEKFHSYNPAKQDQVVGTFSQANPELAARAIEKAEEAFETWRFTPAETRGKLLLSAAKILRDRKFIYAAWMIYEVGKSWAEADADVAEAIGFCEFYAREMLRLDGPQPLTPVPGERNRLEYLPLGVGAVIPPWNFPLALLAGNTVALKPSSDSPTIAFKFWEALEEAGMPPGVVNFLPGPGSTAGNALVAHPRTRFVAFTGSKEVGLRINELAAKPQPGQIWIKRSSCRYAERRPEMGGLRGRLRELAEEPRRANWKFRRAGTLIIIWESLGQLV